VIIVTIDLHDANTGERRNIGELQICNVGGTIETGEYSVNYREGNQRYEAHIERFNRCRGAAELAREALDALGEVICD
jgi:hypothetical protein